MKKLILILTLILFTASVALGGNYPFPYPKFKATDGNGNPLRGGLLYTYVVNSSTNKATYSDAALTTANSNPVVLDSSGEAIVYLSGAYKMNLKDRYGNQMPGWPLDNIGYTSSNLTIVTTLAELRALAPTTDGETVYCSGRASLFDNYQGSFTWNSGDLSTEVTVDTRYGIYVPPTGEDGSDGAWVREHDYVDMKWFGVSPSESAANNADYGNVAIDTFELENGKIIYTVVGTTTIDDVWTFVEGNVEFVLGKGVTIKSDGVSGYMVYFVGTDKTTRISNIYVHGGTLDGNSQEADIGLNALFVDDVVVENVETNDFLYDGISIAAEAENAGFHNYNIKILNCVGDGNGAFGVIVNRIQNVEVAGNYFINSGDSDIDVKNCAAVYIHDNYVSGATEYGINIRNSQYGVDTYGIVSDNYVESCGKAGIYIHNDNGDVLWGITGQVRDVTVTGNVIYSPGWSGIDVQGMTGEEADRVAITGNTVYDTGTSGISFAYAISGSITGNVIDTTTAGYGIVMLGVQDSAINDNSIKGVAATYELIRIKDAGDGTTFCLRNTFVGNILTIGSGLVGIREFPGDNSDYNIIGLNMVTGYSETQPRYQITGANTSLTDHAYIIDQTGGNSPEDTNWNAITTYPIALYELGPGTNLRIFAYGTKTGSAGNKALRFYYGSSYVDFHAAANNTNNWSFDATIFFDDFNDQTIVWTGIDSGNAYLTGASSWTEDASANPAPDFYIYGQTADAADEIDVVYCRIERIK